MKIDVPSFLMIEHGEQMVREIMYDFKDYEIEWEFEKVEADFFDLHLLENHFPENLLLFNLYLKRDGGKTQVQDKAAKIMYNLHKITNEIKEYKFIFAGILGSETKLICLTKPEYDSTILMDSITDTITRIDAGEIVYSSAWGEYFHKNNLGGTMKTKFVDEHGNPPPEQITEEDINSKKFKRIDMLQLYYNDSPDIKTEFSDVLEGKENNFMNIIIKLHEKLKKLHNQ